MWNKIWIQNPDLTNPDPTYWFQNTARQNKESVVNMVICLHDSLEDVTDIFAPAQCSGQAHPAEADRRAQNRDRRYPKFTQ